MVVALDLIRRVPLHRSIRSHEHFVLSTEGHRHGIAPVEELGMRIVLQHPARGGGGEGLLQLRREGIDTLRRRLVEDRIRLLTA